MDAERRAKYRRTHFLVFGLRSTFVFHHGEMDPHLDGLLVKHDATAWAYLTAFNPKGRLLPFAENRRRQLELERDLRSRYPVLAGYGIAHEQDEPWSEPSFLVLGMDKADALAVGMEWDQEAIVVGTLGTAPCVVDCNTGDPI